MYVLIRQNVIFLGDTPLILQLYHCYLCFFQSELIYVNYGRVEDYKYIEENMASVNISGKIVIARYGKIFRGDKVSIHKRKWK